MAPEHFLTRAQEKVPAILEEMFPFQYCVVRGSARA